MIDVKRISFIEKENKSFVRYVLSKEETISKTELRMLKNNDIHGILKISEIQDDEGMVLLYNITSKIQLSQRFSRTFSGEQMYKMLESLCRVWMCTDEYMLDRSHFILYPEMMCVDLETSEICIMVLPVHMEDNIEIEFRRVLAGIFQYLIYDDSVMPDFYFCVLEYVNQHNELTANGFLDFLEKAYQKERGILQSISKAPDAPENIGEEGKELVEEEVAKKILQARFQAQNDEVIFLEDAAKKISGEPMLRGKDEKKNFGFLTPAKEKTGKVTVPYEEKKGKVLIPSSVGNKKNEAEAEKKEKKKKPLEKKEEKTGKEKKGMFHLFGKKKEKEEVEVPKPKDEKKTTLADGRNDNSFPTNEKERFGQNPGMMNGGMPYRYDFSERGGNPAGSGIYVGRENRNDYGNLYGKDQNQKQGMGNLQYSPWTLHSDNIGTMQERKAASEEKKIKQSEPAEYPVQRIDLDATILSHPQMDLDATILDGENRRMAAVPVLRSRETGEIIKITYSGFLVGRLKMKNGVVVKLPNVKQPDLVLSLQNISHSHASFFLSDGRWFVKDENSLNGTFVNEENIGKCGEKLLEEGDVVRFASEEYEFLMMSE